MKYLLSPKVILMIICSFVVSNVISSLVYAEPNNILARSSVSSSSASDNSAKRSSTTNRTKMRFSGKSALKISPKAQSKKAVKTYTVSGVIKKAKGSSGRQSPLAEVVVKLLAQDGTVMGSTSSNKSGTYKFTKVPDKTAITVTFEKLGWTFTPASARKTIKRKNVTINTTAIVEPLYSVSGTITNIDDGPGTGGPLPGVTVKQLDSAGQIVQSIVTDASGVYVFAGAHDKSAYTIVFEKPGWVLYPSSEVVTIQKADAFVNSTALELRYLISGTVTDVSDFLVAGAPLPGVTVTAVDQERNITVTTVTDISGFYFFATARGNSTYTITFEKQGWILNPPTQEVAVASDNVTLAAVGGAPPYAIGGTVINNDTYPGAGGPLSGVIIKLLDTEGKVLQSLVTDATGIYRLSNIAENASYTITFEKQGWIFTPSSQSGIVQGSSTVIHVSAVEQRYAIRGSVIDAVSRTPLTGVTVAASELSSGQNEQTVQTNQSGQFSLLNARGMGRRYLLTFSKNKFVYNFEYPDVPPFVEVQFTDIDVGEISGFKSECDFHGHVGLSDLFSTSLGGATVTLTRTQPSPSVTVRQATTDPDGRYEFSAIGSGTYFITAQKEHYDIQLDDGNHDFYIDATNQKYIDFTHDCEDFGPATEYNFTAQPVLSNPAYGLWTVDALQFGDFVAQSRNFELKNIAELVNPDLNPLPITTELYDISGSLFGGNSVLVNTTSLTLPPQSQQDIMINDLVPPLPDTGDLENFAGRFGFIKMTFGSGRLGGRVAYYHPRLPLAATLLLAFSPFDLVTALPYENPQKGISYFIFNGTLPGLQSSAGVSHGFALVNLSSAQQTYTLNQYDIKGRLIEVFDETGKRIIPFQFTVDPGSYYEDPGSTLLVSIGLSEIVPQDNSAPYLLNSVRFGAYAGGEGVGAIYYDFVFLSFSQKGNGGVQFAPISRERESSNFLEIANILDNTAVDVDLVFFNAAGDKVGTSQLNLAAHAQQLVNAGAFLKLEETGFVRISPSVPDSIIGQSMFYVHNRADLGVMNMHGVPLRQSFAAEQTGSYNRFYDMSNWLRLTNVDGTPTDVTVYVRDVQGGQKVLSYHLAAHEAIRLGLQDGTTFGTSADSIGLVSIEFSPRGAIVADVLRRRDLPLPFSFIDFSYPSYLR